MKYLIFALFAVSAAFGQTVNTVKVNEKRDFRIDNRTLFGSVIFYACDSVEDRAEYLLKELGASDIEVDCRGGLRPWGGVAMPAYVKASFSVKMASDDGSEPGSYEVVDFRSHGDCHLYSEIFKGVKSAFDIKDVDQGACFRADRNYTLKATVLK